MWKALYRAQALYRSTCYSNEENHAIHTVTITNRDNCTEESFDNDTTMVYVDFDGKETPFRYQNDASTGDQYFYIIEDEKKIVARQIALLRGDLS
jgi:hypothetical protein